MRWLCRTLLAGHLFAGTAGAAGPNVYVVPTNAAAAAPYDTWAKAATNIQTAVDYASTRMGTYGTVIVSNGTYNITSQISITNGITVRSYGSGVYGGLANARRTILQGDGGSHRIVNMNHASATLDGLTVRGGYNVTCGAGVRMNAGATVSNCVITSNIGNRGAGVYAGEGACVIVNSEITDNTCPGGDDDSGGGISSQEGAAVFLVRNCLIARNHSLSRGGALFKRGGGKVTFENCTITGNSTDSADSGSGIFTQDNDEVLLMNCVIFGNGPGVDLYRSRGVLSVAYSCIGTYAGDVALGTGVITGKDPQFRNFAEGDYQLCTTSPCIDKGTNEAWTATGRDLAGNPRRQAVRGAGAVVDMGAYEHNTGLVAMPETVVLDDTTLWRQFHVAGPSRIRTPAGKLEAAQIDWTDNWVSEIDRVGSVTNVWGGMKFGPDGLWSAPPPPDWTSPGFDDGAWPRLLWPQPTLPSDCNGGQVGATGRYPYDTVLVLARATFAVKDPSQVKACRLSLDYWGGVVVCVNGKEAARGHMAAGAVSPTASAADYPDEAFMYSNDSLPHTDRLATLRNRRLRNVAIPVSLLRPGVNVLTIEAHASPIPSKALEEINKNAAQRPSTGWPPVGLLKARLAMSQTGAGVVANRSRPGGFQVWNCAADETVTTFDYGNPADPLRPIMIHAGRNSVFSGRLVVGSDQPIRGLKATVTDLAQTPAAAKLSASAVRVRYAIPATSAKCWLPPHRFDGLTETIPAEIPLGTATRSRDWTDQLWHYTAERKIMVPGAVAPLWFTIRVPKDSAPGLYEGTVTVTAQGSPAVTVPLRVKVSAWTAPDPQDFRVQNHLYYAEEVIPRHYGVPAWSDRHFAMLGQTLALLAEVNSRQVQLNLAVDFFSPTEDGSSNPESLVRWIKQPDGAYKHDFTNFDRYLETVAQYAGKPNALRLNCWGQPNLGGSLKGQLNVTVFDPATRQLSVLQQPPLGTEANYRFWKPVFDEALKKLAARGWLDRTTFGYIAPAGYPPPQIVDVAGRLWPKGEWSFVSHEAEEDAVFKGSSTNVAMPVRHADVAKSGTSGRRAALWDLDAPRRNTYCWSCRTQVTDTSPLTELRRQVELLAVIRGYDGVGEFGANLFPLTRPAGGTCIPGAGRGTNWSTWWASILALLYPGPDGPLPTERFEMFREGVELCEAMLYVQHAIASKQLSPDLEQRANRYLCPVKVRSNSARGERAVALQRGWFSARKLQAEEDARLLDLAGEVAQELRKK